MILLQPGDPLPPLALEPSVHVHDYAGRYLLIVCSDAEFPETKANVAVLRVSAANDPHRTTARRLSAGAAGDFLAVLVDPAGMVLQSWAGREQIRQVETALADLAR